MQTLLLASSLKEAVRDIKIFATSPELRCLQTAEIIAEVYKPLTQKGEKQKKNILGIKKDDHDRPERIVIENSLCDWSKFRNTNF